jgi:hypothetical protein
VRGETRNRSLKELTHQSDLPLVQASAPRSVRDQFDLSHVKKTLSPGVPVLPSYAISGCRWAVACVLRGSLAYRGPILGYFREKNSACFEI